MWAVLDTNDECGGPRDEDDDVDARGGDDRRLSALCFSGNLCTGGGSNRLTTSDTCGAAGAGRGAVTGFSSAAAAAVAIFLNFLCRYFPSVSSHRCSTGSTLGVCIAGDLGGSGGGECARFPLGESPMGLVDEATLEDEGDVFQEGVRRDEVVEEVITVGLVEVVAWLPAEFLLDFAEEEPPRDWPAKEGENTRAYQL